MYHTTVGQILDQSVGEGGFPSIGYAADADDVLHDFFLELVKKGEESRW